MIPMIQCMTKDLLQSNFPLVRCWAQSQSGDHVRPPFASSLLPCHVLEQLRPLVHHQAQIPLTDLISVASSCLQLVGERSDLGRQDANLHLATARVGTGTDGLLDFLDAAGQGLRREGLVGVVAAESLDAAADVGVALVLGRAVVHVHDALQSLGGLGVVGGVPFELLLLEDRVRGLGVDGRERLGEDTGVLQRLVQLRLRHHVVEHVGRRRQRVRLLERVAVIIQRRAREFGLTGRVEGLDERRRQAAHRVAELGRPLGLDPLLDDVVGGLALLHLLPAIGVLLGKALLLLRRKRGRLR